MPAVVRSARNHQLCHTHRVKRSRGVEPLEHLQQNQREGAGSRAWSLMNRKKLFGSRVWVRAVLQVGEEELLNWSKGSDKALSSQWWPNSARGCSCPKA